MDSVAWFMAGGIAATAGAVSLVLFGGWASLLGAIVAGSVLATICRRLSSFVGAALVAGVVAGLIAHGAVIAVLLALASFVGMGVGTVGLIAACRWVGTRADRWRHPRHDDLPVSGAAVPAETAQPAAISQLTAGATARSASARGPLPAIQMTRLLRLEESDPAKFRTTLTRLTGEQRRQVRDALAMRRGRASDDGF